MKILLLDMDDVLLRAKGYHQALQETVALMGRSLGYRNAQISEADILVFEAAGVNSEWDSSAVCLILMLEKVWTVNPALRLPASPLAEPELVLDFPVPNFTDFARQMGHASLLSLRPVERTAAIISESRAQRTAEQNALVDEIIRNARQIEGFNHRIFQELVLGSAAFATVYGLEPQLHTESYLATFDRPNLTGKETAALQQWLSRPEHKAAIFTNRPCAAPQGYFGTPEAEIGAKVVGLSNLPIIGQGGLSWLSEQYGKDAQYFLKPSPLHALAAMRTTLGEDPTKALVAAAALVMDHRCDALWQKFNGAQVYIFEDTRSGLLSGLSACELLAGLEIPVTLVLSGVAQSPDKIKTLQATGAPVFPSLAAALQSRNIL